MKKMSLLGSACLLAALVFSPLAAQVEKPISPIQTDEGLVAGKTLPSGVKAWLGVPFAKPPVNNLRWMPPQAITWKGYGMQTARCRNACRFCAPTTSITTSARNQPAKTAFT